MMYKIAKFNEVSQIGLDNLSEKYTLTEDAATAHGIILRSHDMHDMKFSNTLLAIGRAGAGVNNIPIDRCAKEGIVVFNTPGANANAVKELVLAGMFLAARNIPLGIEWASTLTDNVSKSVEKGKSQFAGCEILGKTLGIIGLGAIGVLVANSAQLLGMSVISFDPYLSQEAKENLNSSITIVENIEDVFSSSDFISLHVPSLETTNKMINEDTISKMKDGVVILNYSRDKLVDDNAILNSLENGKVSAYVTDFPNDTVLNKKGVIAIPHLGASTSEAEDNCATMAILQLMDYIERGNIVNSVNFRKCYLPLSSEATCRVSIICNDVGRGDDSVSTENIEDIESALSYGITNLGAKVIDSASSSKGGFLCAVANVAGEVSEEDLKNIIGAGVIKARVLPV